MKITCLLFLSISWATLTYGTGYAVPESVLCPLPCGEGIGHAVPKLVLCPLPWGEGVPRSRCTSSGRGRVRGHWGPASQQTSPANSASDHPRDPDALHRDAASPRDGRHQTGGKASDEQRNHGRASDPNHPPSRAPLIKVNRPKQLPNSRQRSLPGNALHQPGSNKSGGAAKGGLIQNETVNNALAVRTPSVVRPTVLSPNNVRHRSPNPAVVSGSPNSHSSNTGSINGTRMSRKP
jgi:hypothetical protein